MPPLEALELLADIDQPHALTADAPALRWQQTLAALAQAGGPTPEQYPMLENLMQQVHEAHLAGDLSAETLHALRHSVGAAMGLGTLQGRSWLKPYGYAGDFQLIDDIYQQACSPNPHLRAWDDFFHTQAAAKAVRNRKAYFKALVQSAAQAKGGRPLKVLNVASGPCRDVAELLAECPELDVHITCVDLDEQAIAHARRLCDAWPDQVRFVRGNALRLVLPERFDLVWSAGLLDYFSDPLFVRLMRKFISLAQPDGEVVVGNFSADNPSMAYQAWGDWLLIHRSPEQLRALAAQAGVTNSHVEAEPEGVNLFLRMRASATSA
ncbi:class I SAM-dependent methyltransferase [Ideonella paludis]|uniref:Class I SAM-dependent methyltransferase n=1 Tax=Ideonella paludis TaxID=1233411 RepID=A0ABS5DTL1_9BURK|nr:class I SAM-dependent methyltransferase [Ideonella paludis]MBQ0934471.1 class I SAM-dependent methyltransferase [Ideonella paludis]